jgi:hypothetical protein
MSEKRKSAEELQSPRSSKRQSVETSVGTVRRPSMEDGDRRESTEHNGGSVFKDPVSASPTRLQTHHESPPPPLRPQPPAATASSLPVLPPNLWNEINRLTNANRQLIIDFISGKYIKADTELKKLILMHRIEIIYKNAPHFERYCPRVNCSLFMELDYMSCTWKKIRKKKIMGPDRVDDANDFREFQSSI